MKTLFVTDMDGTLLSTDSRVSRRSAEIISTLSRRGALITVATARTPATVEPLLADTLTRVPAIVMTGAALWDRDRHKFLNPVLFPAQMARETAAAMTHHGVNPFVYSLTPENGMLVHHCGPLTRREDSFYQERRSLPLKKFIFDPAEGYASPFPDTILLLGIGETETIGPLADDLRQNPMLSVSAYSDIFNPRISYIEVFSAGVSKAGAVMRLKEMTGADRVVVYGDNLNDLPMFEVADESVSPSNARPEVIERATRVIGPNTADSVALDMAAIFHTLS
ncbi:MAG: Cof-type HAD-IIB family hydrolase [Muribaculaceae bacterium]|nr:Cof-type HAD-IIB family hydrolase [Muribaculaceae bacterium]